MTFFTVFFYRVNAILPGYFKTPMVDTVPEKVIQGVLKMVPLARMGDPLG